MMLMLTVVKSLIQTVLVVVFVPLYYKWRGQPNVAYDRSLPSLIHVVQYAMAG